MRIFYEVIKIIIGVILGVGIIKCIGFDNSSNSLIALNYAEFVSISLTAVTVVLGALALIVGIAAVFGFQMIKTESIRAMEEQLKKDLPTMLSSELKKMEKDGRLVGAVDRAIHSGGPTDDQQTTVDD